MESYNLFISHSWNYGNGYKSLVNLLDQADDFYYSNFSIPENDPVHTQEDEVLIRAIQNHMQSSDIVLVLAGVYATYSKWINMEILIAQKGFTVPKPILAIEPYGSERTSQIVKDNANKIVAWNTNSIVSAIKELV